MNNTSNTKNTKARVMAGILSAITIMSVATTSVATVGAASPSTVSAVTQKNTRKSLSINSVKSNDGNDILTSLIKKVATTAATKTGTQIGSWAASKILGEFFGVSSDKTTMSDVIEKIEETSEKIDKYHDQEMDKLNSIESKIDVQQYIKAYHELVSTNKTMTDEIKSFKNVIKNTPDEDTISAYKTILNSLNGTSFQKLQNNLNAYYTNIKSDLTLGFMNFVKYAYNQASKGDSFDSYTDLNQVGESVKAELNRMALVTARYASIIDAYRKMQYDVKVASGKLTASELKSEKTDLEGYIQNNNDTLTDIFKELNKAINVIDNKIQANVTVNGVTKGFDSISQAWKVANTEIKAGKDVTIKLNNNWTADKTNGLSTNILMANSNNYGFTKDGGLYLNNGGKLTLDLNGYTIDMANKSNVTLISLADKAKVDIKNGTIENAKYAIYGKYDSEKAADKVEISDTTITNCENGAVYMEGYQNNSIKMTNCKVNNTKNGTGVAAKYQVYYDIENCSFDNNHSNDSSGALRGEMDLSKNSIVKNCTFTNNSGKNGGAVGSVKTVQNCTFTNNKSTDKGGAVYFVSGDIKDCTFTGNFAQNEGGAVWHQDNIYNCTFNNNSTNGKGGALFVYPQKTNVFDCHFNNNTAKSDGGAIYFYQDRQEVQRCTFNNNTSVNECGGAIEFNGDDQHSDYIRNCNFDGNSARCGGAVSLESHADGNFYDCTFTHNSAKSDGGALWLGVNSFTNHAFYNVTITNNTAGNRGGGVYAHSNSSCTGSVNAHKIVIIKDNHRTDGKLNNFYGSRTNCGIWKKTAKIEKKKDFDKAHSFIQGNE